MSPTNFINIVNKYFFKYIDRQRGNSKSKPLINHN